MVPLFERTAFIRSENSQLKGLYEVLERSSGMYCIRSGSQVLSIVPSAPKLRLVKLSAVSPPSTKTLKLKNLLPTSPTSLASFSFFSGIFQLLTSHHHLRILLPTVFPPNFALRFQYRQPDNSRVHKVPCTSGRTTWSR